MFCTVLRDLENMKFFLSQNGAKNLATGQYDTTVNSKLEEFSVPELVLRKTSIHIYQETISWSGVIWTHVGGFYS
jgi:hypothetical protein